MNSRPPFINLREGEVATRLLTARPGGISVKSQRKKFKGAPHSPSFMLLGCVAEAPLLWLLSTVQYIITHFNTTTQVTLTELKLS